VNLTDFFIKSEDKYFTVKTIDTTDPENPVEIVTHYKQSSGAVEEIGTLPSKPESKRIKMANSDFSISDFDYLGTIYSDVVNKAMSTGMMRCGKIDGFSYFSGDGGGLYLNVSEKQESQYSQGLYFYPVNRTSSSKVLDAGRLW